MATLPIHEAAVLVGASEATLRQWVIRGHLEPVRRGAKPLRFNEEALTRCAADRLSKAEHARLDALWGQVLAR